MAGVGQGKKWERLDFGLFLMRFFVGTFIFSLGLHSFMGGPPMLKLTQLGASAHMLHFPFSSLFWGAVEASCFVVAGVFVLLGFLFRPALLLISLIQGVVLWPSLSWRLFIFPPIRPSVILLSVCFSLFFTGPGKYSVRR
jgi:putative oxidoreductase